MTAEINPSCRGRDVVQNITVTWVFGNLRLLSLHDSRLVNMEVGINP